MDRIACPAGRFSAQSTVWICEAFLFGCLFTTTMRSSYHGERMYSPVAIRIPRSAARCKLPFTLRPGLSQQERECTKEIYKKKYTGKLKERRDSSPTPRLPMP